MLNAMPGRSRRVASVTAILSLVCAGSSPAFASVVKNELGMYAVKCQAVKHESGNPIVGLVYGNHKKDPGKAEDGSNQYVSKFGSNVHKRHCCTQPRYKNSGAFISSGDLI